MVLRYTRLRFRRRLRFRKRQMVGISLTANKQLDRHIFRRWHNFEHAGRFAIGWIGLIVLLIVAVAFQTVMLGQDYLKVQPVSGGVYTEGIIGTFSNANPIYATDDVDISVSKLIFDSLFSYNDKNQLVGDLASSWEVNDKGDVYTVHLKPKITWHDGQPFTAEDVVFTYTTIQNPDAKSPYMSNWTGIKVEKLNDFTVKFTLPNAYSPFIYSLVSGILPQHALKDIPASQLRSASFNTKNPVGTGAFSWKEVLVNSSGKAGQSETIQLVNFDHYHDGKPKLDGIAIRTYKDKDSLLEAVNSKHVIGAAGLDLGDQDIAEGLEATGFNLMSANMLFLKTTAPNLGDVKVRQALIKATNIGDLIKKIGYPVIPVNEPLLLSQVGYNPEFRQITFDKTAAIKQFEEAGWLMPAGSLYRHKDGKQLDISLAYENSRDFSIIATELQKQWAEVGVNLTIDVSRDKNDSRRYIESHEYDALLYGISIGPDPDVYVYWHSSQIGLTSQTRLNLSEYKSATADLALEAARTRSDPQLRTAKYKPFLEAWRNDAPAIGLYQPRYLFVANQHIYGLNGSLINVPSDRFNQVDKWMINTARSN